MRNLLILIGSPASGKSTWIKENNLEQYTLSPDIIRLMLSSPIMTLEGEFAINQDNDKQVWELMMNILEKRMEQGHFTIIDATHTRKKYLKIYEKLCDKYRYRLYGKVFDLSLEQLLENNNKRDKFKKVSENVIRMHHSRMKEVYIQKSIKLIEYITEINEFVRWDHIDKNIWFIGDIHGQYQPLKQFVDKYYNKNNMYVFMGDYIDRGENNVGVINLLLELYNNKNIVLLEGNHEKWLWLWATERMTEVKSNDFINNTFIELEKKNFDKKLARIFYRNLQTFFTCRNFNRYLFACHGGIPSSKFNFIPTQQLVKGIGRYEDDYVISNNFNERRLEDTYLIHGHRNISMLPIQQGAVFNLEGKVEFAGELRIVKFGKDIETFTIKNDYFYKKDESKKEEFITTTDPIEQLNRSKNIVKKEFGDITSYNFSRNVFYNRTWNKINTKARGLFINKKTNKVVARSYNKFFNINEVEETKVENLVSKLKYPVYAFEKINGGLGIIGYNDGKILYCSKSTVGGLYAELFEKIIKSTHFGIEEKLLERYKTNDYSYVFEVIDIVNDPHIIRYDESKVVLLDIIKNSLDYEKINYSELLFEKSKDFRFIKKCLKICNKWSDIAELMNHFDELYPEKEGIVFEDSNNFMFKFKGEYYKKWKSLRYLKDKILKSDFMITNSVFDAESIDFLKWCKMQSEEKIKNTSIIQLRKEFKIDK